MSQKSKEQILDGIFNHTPVTMPEDTILKISPSMISKFFEYPVNWYKEAVLGEESEFQGNTATVLGSMCHAVYESVINGIKITREEFDNALANFCMTRPDIDYDEIAVNYPVMSAAVVNEFLLKDKLVPEHSEIPLIAKIRDGVYIGGSCDYIPRGIVTDFKHVSRKPDEITIPWNYKIQLLAYRHAAKVNGIYVEPYIQIVYGVKPQKTIGARCIVVREEVTYIDEQKAMETFKLMADSVITCKENPELTYMIFKSYQFKIEE